MGNTTSWSSDLLESTLEHVLPKSGEPPKTKEFSNAPPISSNLSTNNPQNPSPCSNPQNPSPCSNNVLRATPLSKKRRAPPINSVNQSIKYHMCKHMKRKGACLYGDKCKFAHSKYELYVPAQEFCKRKHMHLRLAN